MAYKMLKLKKAGVYILLASIILDTLWHQVMKVIVTIHLKDLLIEFLIVQLRNKIFRHFYARYNAFHLTY